MIYNKVIYIFEKFIVHLITIGEKKQKQKKQQI